MKKNLVTALVLLLTITVTHAQSRRELLKEVEDLETRLRDAENALSEVKRQERINSAKVESYEAQVEELKTTNTSLLQNLNNFTEASTRRSENISSTLNSLRQVEGQLSTIKEALTSRDSINLAVFTLFKQTLGPDPKITMSKGAITVSLDNDFLFGGQSKSTKITPSAETIIGKIGNILKANPTMDIEIVSNSNLVNTDAKKNNNWKISTQQAATVASIFEDDYEVEPKRIRATGKSELGLYSIETATEIIVQPKFYEFYQLVKDTMK
ncbi:OmpA family protein [Arenibacter latericius]|uniref:OmpA family protein n=1 Tax=Arenibacter latericius TaxID=86104 RepID=UPI00040D7C34|nr:OmpA family protein [Arenibacter latericius]MDX1362615.1 OmpA family protein [Arenibacter latericius]